MDLPKKSKLLTDGVGLPIWKRKVSELLDYHDRARYVHYLLHLIGC